MFGLLGCGGGDSETKPLACSWLDGDNCWKSILTAAEACVAPQTESGTLDVGRASCTYASGPVITFNPALTLPVPDAALWKFQIARQGATCLTYNEISEDNFDLTVGDQVFKQRVAGTSVNFTCPDGTSYSGNQISLLLCDLDGFPGKAKSSSGTAVSLSFLGGSTSELQVLSCGQ